MTGNPRGSNLGTGTRAASRVSSRIHPGHLEREPRGRETDLGRREPEEARLGVASGIQISTFKGFGAPPNRPQKSSEEPRVGHCQSFAHCAGPEQWAQISWRPFQRHVEDLHHIPMGTQKHPPTFTRANLLACASMLIHVHSNICSHTVHWHTQKDVCFTCM